VEFFITGEIQAGGGSLKQGVGKNTAIRIMTGAPIPEGADSVIPVELTEENVAKESIRVSRALKQHENIRFAGEDIKRGQVVLKKGKKLLSADIGLLAALNMPEISVYKRPRVAIISTGDELAEVGDELLPGKIRNSNAYTLYSEVKKYNGIPSYLGIAKDSVENIKNTFTRALDYDILISTGGVSMGKYDFVKDVLSELGVNIVIEKLKMKPGKPMIFGSKGATLIFGLPGNPVSTIVSFIEFVRPALLKMSGAEDLNKPELLAVADDDIRKTSGRREFIRGCFYIKNGTIHVTTTGPQGSGLLRSMSIANCLIVMPEESEGCSPGQNVSIQLIHHEEIP
jgi:molybdopterin molybdotransferase